MQWSTAATECLNRRILTKDPMTGEPIETAEEMIERVATNIAGAEHGKTAVGHWTHQFRDVIANLEFLPNSPALVNAGRPLGQLAACFVLPVEDSIEGIFGSIALAAKIHQSGGGTGFSFSKLRPRGSRVKSTGNVASGPVSFMKVFDAATDAIKQGGVRRGANMGVLNVEHPDIREFIHLKNDNKTLSNFNVSVAVSDDFMRHLEHGTPFPLTWGGQEFDKVNPYVLWREIAESAWISGDPGVLFIDRINAGNTVPGLGRIEATNPCGEVPLLPYHTCNLGSINLAKFTKNTSFDWVRLGDVVTTAVRFLDNVIEQNKYPSDLIDLNTKKARKIGLGVMGWADALIQMGIAYGSPESLKLAGEVMRFIRNNADGISIEIGNEKGKFPAFQQSIYGANEGFRNATRTVIAPTGTLSILANCSSGIEPLFDLAITKNVMDTQITQASWAAQEHLNRYGRDRVLRTAHEISIEEHINMQAAFQGFVDDSISKTINFNNNATVDNILDAYMMAWDTNCKGITVFRDGCKGSGQVLESGIMISQKGLCPDCGTATIHKEGCESCPNCGYSVCAA